MNNLVLTKGSFNGYTSKGELIGRLKEENINEILDIIKDIDLDNPVSIIQFGSKATEGISKFSDEILQEMTWGMSGESYEVAENLNKILNKLDLSDFKKQNSKNAILKLLGKAKKSIEEIMGRYESIGDDVQKLYKDLKMLENEATNRIGKLNDIGRATEEYYIVLQKYVLATEIAIEEFKTNLIPIQEQIVSENEHDEFAKAKLNQFRQNVDKLERKLNEFKSSEVIALTTLPIIESVKQGRCVLIEKINSEFITTLPTLKNMLILAFEQKRLEVDALTTKEVEKATERILIENAKMAKESMLLSAEMRRRPTVSVEAIENMVNVMSSAMTDVLSLEDGFNKKLKEDRLKLDVIKRKIANELN